MKLNLRLALMLFAMAHVQFGALSAATVPDDAKAEITRILVEEEAAWRAGDAEAHGAHFAQDGTFTNILGMVFHGREAFIARHAEMFRTIFAKSEIKQSVRRLHLPSENIAIVDLDVELTGYRFVPPSIPTPADGKLRTRLLQVFVKRNAKWEVVAYHNVDLKPSKAPEPTPTSTSDKSPAPQEARRP